jgi:AraC-like DNA-binding protein
MGAAHRGTWRPARRRSRRRARLEPKAPRGAVQGGDRLPPKTAARLLRFEHARGLAERVKAPDFARIAVETGYYDQSHLINEFRSFTGRTPETFFQDTGAAVA